MTSKNCLTEREKALIIDSYDRGVSPSVISTVLNRKSSTITSFYSRFMMDYGLPPKLKTNKCKISAAMGVVIKKIAMETKNRGLRRFVPILKYEMPNESWYFSKNTIGRYLKQAKIVSKKHRLKPFISEQNRLKRIKFATEWLKTTPNGVGDKLGVVIWSDETTMRSAPFTRRDSSYVPENAPRPIQK